MLDDGEDARVRRVGALQVKQRRHFLVDVDAGFAVHPGLQAVDHDVLSLLEAVGIGRRLALHGQNLTDEGRQRTAHRRADAADSRLRREHQRQLAGDGETGALGHHQDEDPDGAEGVEKASHVTGRLPDQDGATR